jgi:putative transposon-encoded protein
MGKYSDLTTPESSVLKAFFESGGIADFVKVVEHQKDFSVLFAIRGKEVELSYSTKNVNRGNSGKVRVFKNYQGALTAIKKLGYTGDVIVSV